MEKVLSFPEALDVVLAQARIVAIAGAEGLTGSAQAAESNAMERVPLAEAAGRVLAEAVVADRDQPPFARSTRDGFAMRAADASGTLRVLGLLKAGQVWQGEPVGAAQAVEIMTGAPLPSGADAVVMVEHVESLPGEQFQLAAGRELHMGENVVPQGAEARAGAAVLRAGTVVGAAEIAVAASCGLAELPVWRKPRVAIVSTGDELVEWTLVKGQMQRSQQGSYALTKSGGSTLVTYSLRVELAMPMLGLLKRKLEKVVMDTALKELKKRVESADPPEV